MLQYLGVIGSEIRRPNNDWGWPRIPRLPQSTQPVQPTAWLHQWGPPDMERATQNILRPHYALEWFGVPQGRSAGVPLVCFERRVCRKPRRNLQLQSRFVWIAVNSQLVIILSYINCQLNVFSAKLNDMFIANIKRPKAVPGLETLYVVNNLHLSSNGVRCALKNI